MLRVTSHSTNLAERAEEGGGLSRLCSKNTRKPTARKRTGGRVHVLQVSGEGERKLPRNVDHSSAFYPGDITEKTAPHAHGVPKKPLRTAAEAHDREGVHIPGVFVYFPSAHGTELSVYAAAAESEERWEEEALQPGRSGRAADTRSSSLGDFLLICLGKGLITLFGDNT